MNYNIFAAPRLDKMDKNGFAPLYLFVYEGQKLLSKKSLGHKIPPDRWNKEQKKVEKKFPNSTLINSVISKHIEDLRAKILLQEMESGTVNLSALLQKEKAKDMCFFEFAEKQIKEKDYAEETRRAYRVCIDKIKRFKPSLKLLEVDFKFLQSYEAYLRDELGNAPNSVWGNIKIIRTLISDAIKSKYITDDPFKDYSRPKYKQTKRSFLSMDELKKIEDFMLLNKDERLTIVGNYFLFMAYTGLRFSDAIRVNNSHILNDERIVIETQKTKQTANIFLNNKIKPLISYIIANPLNITGQEFNRRVKDIAAICGINKKVSSHIARHSFGASLVSLGVPEKVAQGLLAHGNPASTRIYYHLDNPALDEAMKKFNEQK